MSQSMKQTLFRRALPALLAVALLPDPAAAQSFAGTFADQDMVLTLQPTRGRYNGTLVYDGRFYAVDAEEVGGELRGRFATDGGSFDFRAYFSAGVLQFESNTITYSLRRTGKAGRGQRASAPESPAAGTSPSPDTAGAAAETGPEVGEPPAPAVAEALVAEALVAEPAAPAPPDAAQEMDGGGERDAELAGVWRRQAIDADSGTRLPDVKTLELAGDGACTLRAGPLASTGRWRTERNTLMFRPAGAGAWQPYCRYRVVGSTLLCTFEDGSRQLWLRR